MNISKRFNIYCYFPELISSGTDGFYFLNCLQVFGRRLTLVFYQQLHVVVNSPSSVLLLPSASCQRCVYSFPSVCDLYPSSETALLQLSTTSVTRTKRLTQQHFPSLSLGLLYPSIRTSLITSIQIHQFVFGCTKWYTCVNLQQPRGSIVGQIP